MAPKVVPDPTRTLVRWGAVAAGAVIGLAVMVLLTSFFVALGNEYDAVARNLHWYGFGSAVVALFVAGLLAGWVSGVRGAGAGLFHGLTTWGLILVVALAFPFPQSFGVLQIFAAPAPQLGTAPVWAAFLSVLIGAVAAVAGGVVGGVVGGALRPATTTTHEDDPYVAEHGYPPGYAERRDDWPRGRPIERTGEDAAPEAAPERPADEQQTAGRGRRAR